MAASNESLQGSVLQQLLYLIPHHDRGIVRATWDSWVPSINLEASSIVVALLLGVLLWLLFLGLWHVRSGLLDRLAQPRARQRSRRT